MVSQARRIVAFALLLILTGFAPVNAQTKTDGVAFTGLVTQPTTFTAASLAALPTKTVPITYATGHGQQSATYTGVLLWDLLQKVKVVDEGKNSFLRRYLVITARDGYTIVMSMSELDPDYGASQAMVAFQRDGQPMQYNALGLVVPSDHHGGRAVHDVEKIEVK